VLAARAGLWTADFTRGSLAFVATNQDPEADIGGFDDGRGESEGIVLALILRAACTG